MAPSWKWLFVPVLVGGGLLGHHAYSRHVDRELASAPGDATDQFLVDAPAGPRLVLHDAITMDYADSSSRLVVLDARTGALVVSAIFSDDERFAHCWPAAAARIWCERHAGLVLLSSDSLARVAELGALVAAAGLGKPVADRWTRDGTSVSVVLPDGRGARIASDTLAVTALPIGPDSSRVRNPGCPTVDALGDGPEKLSFGRGVRHALLRDASAEANPGTPSGPAFLSRNDHPQLLALPGSSALLVLSDSSLDETGHPLISRVDATPALLWSAPLEGGCEFAAALDDVLVVASASSAGWPRARGIDLRSGASRWTYHP